MVTVCSGLTLIGAFPVEIFYYGKDHKRDGFGRALNLECFKGCLF